MNNILLLEADISRPRTEATTLESNGFTCFRIALQDDIESAIEDFSPDLIIIDLDDATHNSHDLVKKIRELFQQPILALFSENGLDSFDFKYGVNDFMLKSSSQVELVLRIKHALFQAGAVVGDGILQHADLMMDTTKYEVSVAGLLVDLSFKEYELLRVLISNKGKVLTRQTLLDKVWGYDYFGGDRTVDVHVRRLRSKIEGPRHSFVETVRNVGYKFKEKANINAEHPSD